VKLPWRRGVRRGALLGLIAALCLAMPIVSAGAEPRTTPVSEPPNTTPTTAAPPCLAADGCRPIGSMAVEPDQGLATTDLAVSGDCGRSLASDEDSIFTPAIAVFAHGSFGAAWGQPPAIGSRPPLPYLDVSRGTFAYQAFSFASFLMEYAALAEPGLYYFTGQCTVAYFIDGRWRPRFWNTPPATFCMYAPDDDPAGCTSTPSFADLAHQLGEWGFFSGQFIEQIGAQFTPAPAPLPPETTTTTRRRTTTTTPVIVPPPAPAPDATTTTSSTKPCPKPPC